MRKLICKALPNRFQLAKSFLQCTMAWLLVLWIVSWVSAQSPILTKLFGKGRSYGHPPQTQADPAIEELAANIDWLDHQVERWGSIVAKSPDIWGDARLTKYRQEIEDQFKLDIVRFDEGRINAAQIVSDQAFLAAAFALRSGLAGNDVPKTDVKMNGTTLGTDADGRAYSNVSSTIAAITPRNFSDSPLGIGQKEAILIEQTTSLNQKQRYLSHLNTLRRNNEGDDISDSPGYALNLIRFPVSILPGAASQRAHGAEISFTIASEMTPDLLPNAFRSFVVNDLVDQLSIPFTQFMNTDPTVARRLLWEASKADASSPDPRELSDFLDSLRSNAITDQTALSLVRLSGAKFRYFDPNSGIFPIKQSLDAYTFIAIFDDLETLSQLAKEAKEASVEFTAATGSKRINFVSLQEDVEAIPANGAASNRNATSKSYGNRMTQAMRLHMMGTLRENLKSTTDFPAVQPENNYRQSPEIQLKETSDAISDFQSNVNPGSRPIQDFLKAIGASASLLNSALPTISIPIASTRRSTLPFPPSQLFANYGEREMEQAAIATANVFRHEIVNRQIVHLTDVQAFMRDEIESAYEMLRSPAFVSLWEAEMTGDRCLVNAIRTRQIDQVEAQRNRFLQQIDANWRQGQSLAPLAWCVYIESLLLNERLNEEIQSIGGGLVQGTWLPMFGPNPPMEARQAFNEYVAFRWPIRVFTIDPVDEEQNIAEASTIQRQMQLSVALAFASGEIGAASAINTMRVLQRESGTITQNKSIVGFTHGENNFGWRFYPRFQNPPVQTNATVFFRDLIVGGPTNHQLKRTKELEPGIRECVAIVAMPSFVPTATIDTHSHWFRLDNPACMAVSTQDSMKMSRAIVAMREQAVQCSQAQHRYRDGEFGRLLNRVTQIDAKLPTQTLRCPVPIENASGGFEILAAGTRELSPELLGWYGAPGYDPRRGGRFFLVGDNFSVHLTNIIIGNQQATARLISRQVLEVTLEPGLQFIEDERLRSMQSTAGMIGNSQAYAGFLDAHVATPYGVSGHMFIPVLSVQGPQPNGSPSTTFSLSSGRVDALLSVEISKNQKLSLKDAVIKDLQLPSVLLPDQLKLPLGDATIYLWLSDASGVVGRVAFKGVPQSFDMRSYGVSRDETSEAIRSGGSIHKLLANHLERLFAEGKLNDSQKLMFKGQYSVEIDKNMIQLEGSFPVNFDVAFIEPAAK